MENPVSTEKNWHNWRQNTVSTREEDNPLTAGGQSGLTLQSTLPCSESNGSTSWRLIQETGTPKHWREAKHTALQRKGCCWKPRGADRLVLEADRAEGRGCGASLDGAADGGPGSCLACISAQPGARRDVREPRLPRSCIRWGPQQTKWRQSVQKVIIFLYSWADPSQRQETRRLQAVSGSAWLTVRCCLFIHHFMLDLTWSCSFENWLHQFMVAPENLTVWVTSF